LHAKTAKIAKVAVAQKILTMPAFKNTAQFNRDKENAAKINRLIMEKHRLIFMIIISLIIGIFTGWFYSTATKDSLHREQVSNILKNHFELKKYLEHAKVENRYLYGKVQSARKSYPNFSNDSIAVILADAALVANLSIELTVAVGKVYEADSAALNQYFMDTQDK
jgi:hypothetical protein